MKKLSLLAALLLYTASAGANGIDALKAFVADRPGHDRRYAMDGSKLRALGWSPAVAFDDGIVDTVRWFVEHEAWWRAVRSGDWDAYYERQYGSRLAASVPAEPAG